MQKTLQNLTKAFIGESQARNRYTIYAKNAKKEGYEQISAIFLETADQEREHAKQLFKMIQELKGDQQEVTVEAGAPTTWGNTEENLAAAIEGENHEYTQMYPEFADVAEEEGLPKVAARLRAVGQAEKHHEERFKNFLENLQKSTIFSKEEEMNWTCRKCGYVHKGKTPPKECPSCNHPTGYFQVQCEQY